MNLATVLDIVLKLILLRCTVCDLGCINENGQIVDWYVLYKLPKNASGNGSSHSGETFATLDSLKGNWVLSSKSISDITGPLGRTTTQINERTNFSYLVYNDEDPNDKKVNVTYGHTKGVLAVDESSGFWIVHSIPKFPDIDSKTFYYPDSAKLHGQSILCISFQQDMLATIVTNFLYTKPYIYARKYGTGLSTLPHNLQALFNGKPSYITKPPWKYTVAISSINGHSFTLFGKHTKWGHDLYDAFVAPSLATSLMTETWRLGSGDPLPSTCDLEFSVINVKDVSLKFHDHRAEFRNSLDHSKWALSQFANKPWVCVGDINRVKSQEKRGGGTLCTRSATAWRAFKNSVVETESCPTLNEDTIFLEKIWFLSS